jgi:hypothetical protein
MISCLLGRNCAIQEEE